MKSTHVDEAVELLEKANADLKPELLSIPEAQERLKAYARAQRLAAFGVAALARTIDEASSLARVTGTSVGKAKETIATSKVLGDSPPLEAALMHGEISQDQATEIAKAEGSAPRCVHRASGGGSGRVLPRSKGEGPQGEARSRTARRPGAASARRP